MGITLLDAHNIIRRAARKSRLASLNLSNPDTAQVVPHLDDAKRKFLSIGLKFNTLRLTLAVDQATGHIEVGSYYKFFLPCGTINDRLVVKSGALFDPYENEFVTDSIDNAYVVEASVWDDIPLEWQEAIAYEAAATYVEQLKGVVPELSLLISRSQEYLCRAEMSSEHYDLGRMNGYNQIIGYYYL